MNGIRHKLAVSIGIVLISGALVALVVTVYRFVLGMLKSSAFSDGNTFCLIEESE